MSEAVTHEEIKRDLIDGGRRFDTIEATLRDILEKLRSLPEMQKDIAETREIVEAWDTAKNVARFIKWMAGIAAAVGVLWAIAKAAAKDYI